VDLSLYNYTVSMQVFEVTQTTVFYLYKWQWLVKHKLSFT